MHILIRLRLVSVILAALLVSSSAFALDSDGDGASDKTDNCIDVSNSTQLDSDSDAYGDGCDCDYDQNETCGFSDFNIFLACFGQGVPGSGPADDLTCAESDQDGNLTVGFNDFTLFLNGFGGPPGPSNHGCPLEPGTYSVISHNNCDGATLGVCAASTPAAFFGCLTDPDCGRIPPLPGDCICGTLKVGPLSTFAFPAGGTIVQDVAPGNANCLHDVVVPFPGGFVSPVFCIPALGFTVSVVQTACGIGMIDSDGGADITVVEDGDTSDSLGPCSLPHAGCLTGADSSIRVEITVGDGVVDTCSGPGTANALVAIPVFTTTWLDTAGCPGNQVFDPVGEGDLLIVLFPQTLDFTTDTNTANFVDLDADGCFQAGAGPPMLSSTGACMDIAGMTVTTAASGPIGSSGAPLFDLTFTTLLPNTITGPTPSIGATCASPPIIPLGGGTATRCIP